MISTREELNIFFWRIHFYFPPTGNKSLFFWTTKMYIFLTYFAKRNFRSHFLREFLIAFGNKICYVCRDEKFQLEEWNTVIIFQRVIMVATCDVFGCTYSCKNILDWVFHRIPAAMLKENDFDRDGCGTFIVQFLCRKMKTFVCSNHFGVKLLLARP